MLLIIWRDKKNGAIYWFEKQIIYRSKRLFYIPVRLVTKRLWEFPLNDK